MKISLAYFLIVIDIASSNPNCSKPKAGLINVHIICHSHDDLGWVYTVDEYYNSSYTFIKTAYVLKSVKDILTSSVDMLLQNSSRKFVYGEIAFFSMWWNEQTELLKKQVKKLVKSGQFEFVNGGWSQNDEATPYYSDVIDQITLGQTFIKEIFGKDAPAKVGWQIDNFGHSREQASILGQMGMKGLIIGRIDPNDLKNRRANKEMEMVWQGSNYLGKNSSIFTSVLPDMFTAPRDLCFDIDCYSPSNPSADEFKKMSGVLVDYAANHAISFLTSNIILPLGGDFYYSKAENWFNNIDILIKYVNKQTEHGVNAFYSTPSCYLEALQNENLIWPSKTDDFFPYSSQMYHGEPDISNLEYWAGFFTSRPTFKRFIRDISNIFRAIRQMGALTGLERSPSIDNLASELGIVIHHDGITGTAKQYVTNDYVRRLLGGLESVNDILNKGFNTLTNQEPPGDNIFISCPLLNISSCPPSEGLSPFVVNVYNPIARVKSHYVRIPVKKPLNYVVKSSKGLFLTTQVIPIPEGVVSIPGRDSEAQYELVFYAELIPPLGVLQFLVSVDVDLSSFISTNVRDQVGSTISNEKFELSFHPETNFLDSITVKRPDSQKDSLKINVTQNWLYYGEKSNLMNRRSGAYVFRTNFPAAMINDNATIEAVYKGPLVTEIHQVWSPCLSQVIRMYKDKENIEFEWLVGPLPDEKLRDIEVINRVTWRDMETHGLFYTDANGREMQKRIRKIGLTMNKKKQSYFIPSNYYPVTSRLILRSQNGEGDAAILNDRAQGGSSLSDGEMELMVHRRLQQDDSKGVYEVLDEIAFGMGLVARGKHYLIHSHFGTKTCDFGCLHRTLGEELILQPILTFSDRKTFKEQDPIPSLETHLPRNLHLLTLESWKNGKWLLRIENFLEKNESSISGGVTFNIKNLFTFWYVKSVEEVNLSATTLKNETSRFEWKTSQTDLDEVTMETEGKDKLPYTFYFAPMQIRTFIVEISYKNFGK
ncbi:UNVERIFIED_CONTAM: hypothetical protein RMT77_011804 [Armadillidium vulgare]